MAVVASSANGTTALTSPSRSSSHGDGFWELNANGTSEDARRDKNTATLIEHALKSPSASQNGNPLPSHSLNSNSSEATTRRIHSSDKISSATREHGEENGASQLPASATESRLGHGSSPNWELQSKRPSGDPTKRQIQLSTDLGVNEEDSKWIHRDKLAKIESEELQAAGIVIPRVRASSRLRRPRAQHSPESPQPQPDGDSTTPEQQLEEETPSPSWDLRLPGEIAEEGANAYFAAQEVMGGTRIPVAKSSPAPIPLGYLERASPSVRRPEVSERDTLAYPKPRSRSVSASAKGSDTTNSSDQPASTKRPAMDGSPKRTSIRKTSTASRSSATLGRPKTRSGSGRDATGTRPTTRPGEPAAASRQPEGDPPWVFDSYKPDPRLPPDQQLLPTVARRLRQEQWAKEGRFGDTYDKDFRPLNDHEFRPPQERESVVLEEHPEMPQEQVEEELGQKQPGDWPLKPTMSKSPKQSFYSTMPKISDTPLVSPVTSPRTPITPPAAPMPQADAAVPLTQEKEEAKQQKKWMGCGCCVVM